MKRRLFVIMTVLALSTAAFAGCGNTQATSAIAESTELTEAPVTEEVTPAEELTETPTEELTVEQKEQPTDVATQPEEITEQPTEEATPEPTQPAEVEAQFTFMDLSATMYAKSTVNVRNQPNADGEKIGGLFTNQEVTVTGQFNETSWYRISYSGGEAFVSDKYLVNEKAVIQSVETVSQPGSDAAAQQPPKQPAQNEQCPYELYTVNYDTQGYPYYYGKWGGSANMDADNWAKTEACFNEADKYMSANYMIYSEDGMSGHLSSSGSWKFIGSYNGMNVVVRYIEVCNDVRLAEPEERGIPTAGNGIWLD